MKKMKSLNYLIFIFICHLISSPVHCFIGKIIKRFGGGDKADDQLQKVKPPPSSNIKYVESQSTDKVVKIDLTLAENRGLNLMSTGWKVHQGQKISIHDFELKGNVYVWDYDFSSCKDTYQNKKDVPKP